MEQRECNICPVDTIIERISVKAIGKMNVAERFSEKRIIIYSLLESGKVSKGWSREPYASLNLNW